MGKEWSESYKQSISKGSKTKNTTAVVESHGGFMELESKIWDKKW